jgi:hypothetical protein
MFSHFPFLDFLSFFESDLDIRGVLDGNPDSRMTAAAAPFVSVSCCSLLSRVKYGAEHLRLCLSWVPIDHTFPGLCKGFFA